MVKYTHLRYLGITTNKIKRVSEVFLKNMKPFKTFSKQKNRRKMEQKIHLESILIDHINIC
jgi:hypothetical protein